MMRRLVLGALLVIMPFGGIRVICIDSITDVSRSSAHTEKGADCERLCPLHQPSSTENTENNGSDCALSADASSLSLVANIAVPRPQEPLQVPLVVATTYSDSPRFYVEPGLAHLSPPPKA